jgi:hypothetical protein
LTNPQPFPDMGQQQQQQQQQQQPIPPGVDTTGPAPLPAIPTDIEEDTSGTTGEIDTGKKPVVKKPKEASCQVIYKSGGGMAKQVGNGLRSRQKAVKECAKSGGDSSSVALGFQVRGKSSKIGKVSQKAATSASAATCLKSVLGGVPISEPETKTHTGTASFKFTRKKGVVTECVIAVEAKATERGSRPPAPKDKDKKPKPGKSGLKIIKSN